MFAYIEGKMNLPDGIMKSFWQSLTIERRDEIIKLIAEDHGILVAMEFEKVIEGLINEA